MTALAASRRMPRAPWGSAGFGLSAIAFACAAHITWYSRLDEIESAPTDIMWMLFIVVAVLQVATATAILLIPALHKARMGVAGATALGLGAAIVAGILSVLFLALPLAGAIIAIAAVVTVLALRRRDSPTAAVDRTAGQG